MRGPGRSLGPSHRVLGGTGALLLAGLPTAPQASLLLLQTRSFPSQVTEETCSILQGLGYSCECRGLINVKGKGELRTYFVCTETAKCQGPGLN